MRAFTNGVLLAAVMGLPACGGGQTRGNLFSTDWDDDGGRSIEAVRQRIGNTSPYVGASVAIGVGGNGDKILGLPLEGGARWTYAHPLDARPVIASSVVVGSGGGELFALDAKTGAKLWARPTGGLQVHGAGDDGSVTAITLSRAGGAGSMLLAVTHDGEVVRQAETDKDLGAPAVVAHLAFVPWGNQYVSVFDLSNGDEAGRVLLREKTSRAWTVGGGLYFGEIGLFRFDDRIKGASKGQATHLALPPRELPGTPKLMVPGDERLGPVAGAPDKIRLYARPSGPTGPLSFDSDRFYATYFRLVMGFTADKGALSWVHTHTSDVIGGAAATGAAIVCDDRGKVTVLDAASGAILSEMDLGEPVRSCAVQAEGYRPTGERRDAGSLASQLQAALENRDLELSTAQRLLLRELATLPDEEATRTLIEIASDPRSSPVLLVDARAALANRRIGAKFMLDALGRHYDFLKDVLRPPPVGPIAQALAVMNEKSAAPLLASHLFDPADTDDDVKQASLALVTLGGTAEVAPLKQFFAMYRAAPSEPQEIPDAVVSAGQGLLKLGGAEGRAAVDQAILSAMTNEDVKGKLVALVAAAEAENPKADATPVMPPVTRGVTRGVTPVRAGAGQSAAQKK